MSDMNSENLPMDQGQENQAGQTRVMQPVESTSRPARRRRSERYTEDEAPQTPQEIAAPAEEPVAQEPTLQDSPTQEGTPIMLPRRTTRVVPAQETTREPVPRPNLLNRAERPQPGPVQEGGISLRRPMGTPAGFQPRPPQVMEDFEQGQSGAAPRQPSGAAPRMPVSSKTARRPAPSAERTPEQPRRSGHKALIAAVVALLVIGLVIVGVMLAKRGGSEDKEPAVTATASGFTAALNSGIAPVEVVFTLTANKAVEQVRLVDEGGVVMTTKNEVVTNADINIWRINLTIEDGFEGLVMAQIYDGANWLDTGMSQSLEIAMPAPAATIDMTVFHEVATDEPAAEPTDAPTEVPTDEPTDVPVIAAVSEPTTPPTEVPTATPTLAVTDTPTIAMASTATPVPASMAATQIPITEVITETPSPEDEETEAPTEEPTEAPTEAPTGVPTATPPLTGVAADSADPSLIKDTVIYNGSSKAASFVRERTMNVPIADAYPIQPIGVLTYRGNAFRMNAASGTVEDVSELSLLWTAEAGSVKGASSTYYGIGWTGQPAIVKWSKEIRESTNIVDEKKYTTALKEVIVAGLDGRIYFLDLADGQATRPVINLGYPMRGTPSVHSMGYPIMAVGQYARKMASKTGDIGLYVYDLLTQKRVYWIDGLDGKANRPYYGVGAFDTSALFDRNSDTMVAIGTNGMLYTAKLNTEYSVSEEKITIEPTMVSMISRTNRQADKYTAVQSSPAMYGAYVYYADMEGILRCVDTTTMTTVWAVDTDDAVEAAIALDMDENGDLWLYTANTLDTRSRGDCTIRRFNALTGEEDWALPVNLVKAKNGKIPGAMASPVIGQYELEDMVYFTLSNVSAAGATAIFGESTGETAGVLLALDKVSGEIVWAHALDKYSYSSPVAVYSKEGQGWIIQASSSGLITLLDGLTGTVINTLKVEGTIDASPAVYGDTLVIGTTGKNTSYIYGIKLQ